MRVAMYYNNRDIRVVNQPEPAIKAGEILVKIFASGICGSDVMEWYRLDKVPLVLGHEIAGEVAAVGPEVKEFQVGDRIAATHHVPCFTCHYCLNGHETACNTLQKKTSFDPGGFCEFARLPSINVQRGTWKLSEAISFDEATFVEPLACVIRGQRRAGIQPGKSVLVLGCGISGILHIHLAAVTGAGLIVATDINDYRLSAAKRLGADEILRADQDVPAFFEKINNGSKADVVIVCTSATKVFEQAMSSVARGGSILLFAPTNPGITIPVSINELFWRRDVTMTTTYAGSPADCVTALELIQRKRLNLSEMITHSFGLENVTEGFRLVAEASESLKVIIRPQE